MSTLLNKHVLFEAIDILGKVPLQSSIRLAFRTLYSDLAQLEDLNTKSDLDVYANKIHRACGPCAIFGAAELLSRLSELEQDLRQHKINSVPQMIEAIRSIAEATEYELRFQVGGVLERLRLALQRKWASNSITTN